MKKDVKKANDLAKKACDAGKPQGCTFIGKAYYGGEGVKKDYKKAAEFYKKSYGQNHPAGCMLLTRMVWAYKEIRKRRKSTTQKSAKWVKI